MEEIEFEDLPDKVKQVIESDYSEGMPVKINRVEDPKDENPITFHIDFEYHDIKSEYTREYTASFDENGTTISYIVNSETSKKDKWMKDFEDAMDSFASVVDLTDKQEHTIVNTFTVEEREKEASSICDAVKSIENEINAIAKVFDDFSDYKMASETVIKKKAKIKDYCEEVISTIKKVCSTIVSIGYDKAIEELVKALEKTNEKPKGELIKVDPTLTDGEIKEITKSIIKISVLISSVIGDSEAVFRKKFMEKMGATTNRHKNPRNKPYGYDVEKGVKFLEASRAYYQTGNSRMIDHFLVTEIELITFDDLKKIRNSNKFDL